MGKTRVLIAVKTYPTLSAKYDELVCTAGFREDGTWVRIYPVPFRKFAFNQRYSKYDWVEYDLIKNSADFRPESYRPIKTDEPPEKIGHLGTHNNWADRKKIVLNKVYTNLSALISEAKNKAICTSLAVFKPTKILDFTYTPDKREWSPKKLEKFKQFDIFEDPFEIVKRVPYKFQYVFLDDENRRSKLMIEDWETCELFWKCLKRYGNEKIACEKVRAKYFDDFAQKKDLYFFLGTIYVNHYRAPNPFIIIGTFHPTIELQTSLF